MLAPSTPNLVDTTNDVRYVWEEAEMGVSQPTAFAYFDPLAGDWEPWTPYDRTRKGGLRVEAIPEPSTLALAAVGIAVIGLGHQRRLRRERGARAH